MNLSYWKTYNNKFSECPDCGYRISPQSLSNFCPMCGKRLIFGQLIDDSSDYNTFKNAKPTTNKNVSRETWPATIENYLVDKGEIINNELWIRVSDIDKWIEHINED